MLPTRDVNFKMRHRLKVKGQKKIFPANENQKKATVAILVRQNRL